MDHGPVRLVGTVIRRVQYELGRRMGREARVEAEQFHGWDRTVERLDELFNQVKIT